MKIKMSKAMPIPNKVNCLICQGKLEYLRFTEPHECAICHKTYHSNTRCVHGHYICDDCHSAGVYELLPYLVMYPEKNPIKLMQQVVSHNSVHLHGPEHHCIVPCVLLATYRNCGGSLDLDKCLKEAVERGRQVPGGTCGNWGACGAAVGAGIFASIVSKSTPLNKEVWAIPQILTARCLERMAEIGGPRCCKRTSYIAIETAAEYSSRVFNVTMPIVRVACTHKELNKECIKSNCPFYSDDICSVR
jgi:hypothetical protein